MSVENNTVVASTEAVAVEKVARIALPEVAVENYKALEISAVKGAVVINVSDIEEYAQVAAVVKTLKAVKYVSGNKGAIIVVDALNLANAEKLLLLNPEIKAGSISFLFLSSFDITFTDFSLFKYIFFVFSNSLKFFTFFNLIKNFW